MKMVKSLLLGSAAGLVAVAGAQAADLPVKAKAVEYVKVCSAYGAGYFYIPGTDTCLKIGGYARFDAYAGAVGTFRPDIATTAGAGFNGPGVGAYAFPFSDKDDADILTRARGVFDMDARTQTDYGTLRSYVRFGGEWNSQSGAGSGPNNAFYFERAFIQFAGFTFGYTQSFFDIGVNYMMTTPFAGSNTWTSLIAYTAQFGNGFSATIALEDGANRVTGVQGTNATMAAAGGTFGSLSPFGFNPFLATVGTGAGLGYQNWQGGNAVPDIVANLRLDQAWGTAMLSGALHQVNTLDQFALFPGASSSDQWGWAIGGALILKADMIGKGDSFLLQASYAKGAISYAGMGGNSQGTASAWGKVDIDQFGNLTGAYVPLADAVVVNGFGDYDLTTAWAIMGQFRHYWTPGLRSVVFGGYTKYEVPLSTVIAVTDADMWQVGTDLVWSPVKNLDLGLEVVYSKVSADVPLQAVATNAIIGGSTDVWSGGIRAQRNF
ncbi:porin [Xanthobacter pseudotagetidis]|uniref:porin n=1 Tax=Xanthobacter pseudotagetidis TaxID=3119911 RepID=UPI003727BF05